MTIRKKDLETEMIQAIANQFESLFQLEFNEGLSADSVLVGLLDHGLFGEKIPPCFVSDGLAEIAEKTFKDVIEREKISKNKHDYIRYEALRDTNITRHLGIPHPESYALQALAIKKYWTEIKAHCDKPDPKVSRVHVRHVGGGRIFEMNYKGSERFDTEEQEIQWKTGAKFIAKADIATCFSSIYTHSIPWALHGRETSKENTGRNNKLPKLYGNLLDSFTQNTRDGQTNGLLIGPHASNIISEIILTCIDVDLQSKSFFKFKRHIDDYVYYAETYEDAEKFIQELVMCLRKYELTLNDKKTLILSLPRPSTENWTQQLNRFVFSKDANSETRFSTIRSFLDLALENAQTCKSSAPLNYAIKILANNQEIPPLNSRAKRLYVHEAINLALAYPYLVILLDRFVFDKFSYDGIKEKVKQFCTNLISISTKKIYPDAISYAIYYSLKYQIYLDSITEEELLKIVSLDDCVVNVLLYDYAKKNKLKIIIKEIENRVERLENAIQIEIDRQWLLIYQIWTVKKLNANGQNFLAKLKESKFKFLSIEPPLIDDKLPQGGVKNEDANEFTY